MLQENFSQASDAVSLSVMNRLTRRLFVAVALAATCAAAACRSSSSSPAPALVTADTLAVVNGRAIARDEVEKSFRRTSNPGQTLSDEEATTARLAILDELIMEEILLSKANELKIQVAESDVDTAYAEAKKNITDDAYQQELTKRNLTTADMRDRLRRELIAQKVLEREVSTKIAVSDQQVMDFFNANRAQFNLPEESYHLAQIVVTPVRDAQLANRTGDDAGTPQAAAAKVKMLMDRLQAGTPFGDLARDFSEDPESAPRGGDLGLVPMSAIKQAAPALRDAVLKLEPGRARVVSGGGAHTIVYVVAHELAGQRDLSTPNVKERITATLKGRREQLLRTAYLAAVRTDADVVNYLARRVVEEQSKAATPAPAPAK
jgi:peptidyl-prolyl cis-trans isomerase SurA